MIFFLFSESHASSFLSIKFKQVNHDLDSVWYLILISIDFLWFLPFIISFSFNSEVCKWCHLSDKTQTNKLEWWMILKISLRAKASVPKTLVKQKLCLHSLYFPQNTVTLTESHGEFSDLHSIFRLCALCFWENVSTLKTVLVHISKCLEVCQKYCFMHHIFNSLLFVWKIMLSN